MARTREYTNGEVTIVWKPESCKHSGICVKGLPNVFRPKVRPWIRIEKGATENLINQVKHCPSGALSYYLNIKKNEDSDIKKTNIEVLDNGPLLIHGTLKVIEKDGVSEIKNETTAFCRCGNSNNKPFCDGAHVTVGFKG